MFLQKWLVKGGDNEGKGTFQPAAFVCAFLLDRRMWVSFGNHKWFAEILGELRALPLIALPVSFYEDMRRCCQAPERVQDKAIELKHDLMSPEKEKNTKCFCISAS